MARTRKLKPYKNKNKKISDKSVNQANINYYIYPIIFIIGYLPFLVRLKVYNPNLSHFPWFADSDAVADFFLYYRHWVFVIVSLFAALVIIYKLNKSRYIIKDIRVFIPLAIYILFAIISSIFSIKPGFSFWGGYEQFETIFALSGYVVVSLYSYLFIKNESDLKSIFKCLLFSSIIMVALGLSQYTGNDFFGSQAGYRLIVPLRYQDESGLNFTFENNRVYLSLYNPNYVGVYTSLLIPLLSTNLFLTKSWKKIVLNVLAIIGLLVCVVGARSLAGVMGIVAVGIFALIFMWRYLLKNKFIAITTFIMLVVLLILDLQFFHMFTGKLIDSFSNAKTNYSTTRIDTNDDNVSLEYKGNVILIEHKVDEFNNGVIVAKDISGNEVCSIYDSANYTWTITDERFRGLIIGIYGDSDIFFIRDSNEEWMFTKSAEDGTYYHINRMGKNDKMITADSAVFTGYEWFATARGYIWSRTIPVLKKYMFIGSGPDTFVMAFPQKDYINFTRYGYGNGIITKPHNMYLQIWAQTGLISLLAFLSFYFVYFVNSFKLYIESRFKNTYEKYGIGIFLSTLAYMITGLTNDSTITVAPIFWCLIGIGMAVNRRVKDIRKNI